MSRAWAKYIEMANCVDSSMNATRQTVLNEIISFDYYKVPGCDALQSLIRIKKKKNRIQSVKKTDYQSTRKNVVELGSV